MFSCKVTWNIKGSFSAGGQGLDKENERWWALARANEKGSSTSDLEH